MLIISCLLTHSAITVGRYTTNKVKISVRIVFASLLQTSFINPTRRLETSSQRKLQYWRENNCLITPRAGSSRVCYNCVLRYLFPLLECPAGGPGEQTVHHGVGSTVERRQTLDERRHSNIGLRARNVTVHLQQVKYDVRAPTQHEHCKPSRFLGSNIYFSS